MSHREFHPVPVDSCFGCKVLSIGISAEALPNRKGPIAAINHKDKVLSDDLAAYKRLRRDGLQPKQIDGSAIVEARANSQFDIDLGHVVPKAQERRVREGFEFAKSIQVVTPDA